MYVDRYRLVRLDLESQVQGQMQKTAYTQLNIARRASECIVHLWEIMHGDRYRLIRFDFEAQSQGQMLKTDYNLLIIARRALECTGYL